MKEQLEILYGEYHTLHATCHDWVLKNQYGAKMDAIITLLKPVYYNATDPIRDEK